jgi:acetyl-CoA synthetase
MERAWKPDKEQIIHTHIGKIMRDKGFLSYEDYYRWTIENREEFWEETLQKLDIILTKKYDSILDLSKGVTEANWLSGAKMNIVDSCFNNTPEAVAIRYSEKGEIKEMSQLELENLVNRIARSLIDSGVKSGDFIAIDMPMTPLAVAIYLAGIKAGIPVATIADSFTPREINIRLKISHPKWVFTQDYIHRGGKNIPLYKRVKEAGPYKCVVIQTGEDISLEENDIRWDEFLSGSTDFESVIGDPADTITLLFSSGTTSEPKAIPWNHTTAIKSAADAYYHHDIHPGDVVAWPTNLGWMMGPWLVFATLINKATLALYDDSPVERGFGVFVQNARINMLGVIPSMVRRWLQIDCMAGLDWSAIRCFSSTGEASNADEYLRLMQLAGGKPIIEYCGGTEIGGGYITSTLVQDNIPATFSTAALGTEFVLLDEEGNETDDGEVFIIPPVMGLSNTLLNKSHHRVYYEDTPIYKGKILRRHGDRMQRLPNGYYRARGRVDDAMNLGGIKVSAIQLEQVVNSLDYIKESAAIAVTPPKGGPDMLVVYYVLKSEKDKKEVSKDISRKIRTQINPLFRVQQAVAIEALPRTASGKLMRRMLRKKYLESI